MSGLKDVSLKDVSLKDVVVPSTRRHQTSSRLGLRQFERFGTDFLGSGFEP